MLRPEIRKPPSSSATSRAGPCPESQARSISQNKAGCAARTLAGIGPRCIASGWSERGNHQIAGAEQVFGCQLRLIKKERPADAGTNTVAACTGSITVAVPSTRGSAAACSRILRRKAATAAPVSTPVGNSALTKHGQSGLQPAREIRGRRPWKDRCHRQSPGVGQQRLSFRRQHRVALRAGRRASGHRSGLSGWPEVWLTVDWARPSRRPAAEKLPLSAAADEGREATGLSDTPSSMCRSSR